MRLVGKYFEGELAMLTLSFCSSQATEIMATLLDAIDGKSLENDEPWPEHWDRWFPIFQAAPTKKGVRKYENKSIRGLTIIMLRKDLPAWEKWVEIHGPPRKIAIKSVRPISAGRYICDTTSSTTAIDLVTNDGRIYYWIELSQTDLEVESAKAPKFKRPSGRLKAMQA